MQNPKQSSKVFSTASKSTLVESVIEQIIASIRDGRFGPGDRLPSERALIEMMNVGRSTVREALQALGAMDLVETRSGSGTIVKDTFQFRRLLAGDQSLIDPHHNHAAQGQPGERFTALSSPQFTATPGPSLAELEANLKQWCNLRPDYLTVESVGESPGGLPILLCHVTDFRIPAVEKQVVLITTTHSGLERLPVAVVLKLIKWLISDDPQADEIRRKQIVLAMPACEPDTYDSKSTETSGYYTSRRGKVYEGWSWDGPKDPENQPEAMAIKQVLDEYQPEVHQDVHGTWYQEATMWESTGAAWASNLYRSYVPEIGKLMNEAAEEAGYLIAGAEEASGQILSSVPVPGAEHWFYGANSNAKPLAGLYAYYHFHTIAQAMEVGWDESGFVRLRRLLEVGNQQWRGEYYAGYPVHQMGCWTSTAIAAWGKTAAERRKSRVELWRKLPQFSFACAHPEPRNSIAAFVATTPAAREQFVQDVSLERVISVLKEDERFDSAGLDEYLRQSPARNVLFRPNSFSGTAQSIKHGLAIRLLIGYPQVEFEHLKLDGHDLRMSESDGYTVYHNPGTIVQVNIPPDKVRDFHVVTAVFDSPEKRPTGFRPEDWQLH